MPAALSPALLLLKNAREIKQLRKKAKLEKILAALAQRKRLANPDICKLLRVSPATTTRYTQELERAGKVKRVGSGKGIAYEPVP
jgi:DeoR/GlpR family transcriptional regulator of sugar metabolism